MEAMVIRRFGGPEVFAPATLPKPRLKAGEVLVEVHASSVNPVDYKLRQGLFAAITPPFPAVLHGDVAGVVVKTAAGVSRFRPGDAVYGCVGGVGKTPGCLAEFVAADARLLAHKPKSLDFAAAAALPLVGITAWEALIDRARVGPGDHVLVHAAAGGVGHIGLQLAKWAGAKVYATASGDEKMHLAKDLGADGSINYRKENVEAYAARLTRGRGFDVVFDTVGGENLDRSLAAAAVGGRVAAIAARGATDLTPLHMKGLTLHAVFMLIPLLYGTGRERHGEILGELARLVDDGRIRVVLDEKRYSFQDAAAAHSRLEQGQAKGKIVLVR